MSEYVIDASIELDYDVIKMNQAYLDLFILATNVTDTDDETVLKHYKNQMLVEKGFRFLKDRSFRVSEVFLKSEKRIKAFCMIMVLCLMVYCFTEWLLRKRLAQEHETVPN
jgi:transposase